MNKTSISNAFKTAIDEAEMAPFSAPSREFMTIIEGLVDALQSKGVGAALRGSDDPRRKSLAVYPAHRPQRANLMLTFFFDGERVTVSGQEPVVFTDPGDLERWLLDFVKLPAFIESLAILRRESEAPVEARLRVSNLVAYSKGDVLVELSPQDQETLDQTPTMSRVDVKIKPVNFPGNGTINIETKYPVLDSAGLVVAVDDLQPVGGKFKLSGVRIA